MFTEKDGLIIVEPEIHFDDRGYFYESYNERDFFAGGVRDSFIQDNTSYSTRGVLRGLHYQKGQAKLVKCVQGLIQDVAVNLEDGRIFSILLSGENHKQLYIPDGWAHGFLCLSETAVVSYKCSTFWDKGKEGGVKWDSVGIQWLLPDVILSERDRNLPEWVKEIKYYDPELKDIKYYDLNTIPRYNDNIGIGKPLPDGHPLQTF